MVNVVLLKDQNRNEKKIICLHKLLNDDKSL